MFVQHDAMVVTPRKTSHTFEVLGTLLLLEIMVDNNRAQLHVRYITINFKVIGVVECRRRQDEPTHLLWHFKVFVVVLYAELVV